MNRGERAKLIRNYLAANPAAATKEILAAFPDCQLAKCHVDHVRHKLGIQKRAGQKAEAIREHFSKHPNSTTEEVIAALPSLNLAAGHVNSERSRLGLSVARDTQQQRVIREIQSNPEASPATIASSLNDAGITGKYVSRVRWRLNTGQIASMPDETTSQVSADENTTKSVDELKERARIIYASGETSFHQIAKQIGSSYKTVRCWLDEAYRIEDRAKNRRQHSINRLREPAVPVEHVEPGLGVESNVIPDEAGLIRAVESMKKSLRAAYSNGRDSLAGVDHPAISVTKLEFFDGCFDVLITNLNHLQKAKV